MYRRRGLHVAMLFLTAGLAVVALAACGAAGTASSPAGLLKQTFSGSHTVTSGDLGITLTVDPTGSSTLKTPITLSFGGPFDSHGSGKLPASNFAITLSSNGTALKVGILSTGTAGYVSLDGTSYQLPTASFQKLESSFASVSSSGTGTSGTGVLGKLGIDPLKWLIDPKIVGDQVVGGASTTHITAGVDVPVLLSDLDTFLAKAASAGVSGASSLASIPAATEQKIAAEIQGPSFDVWTGNQDKTIRQLQLGLTLPVSGQISTLLGGLSSAHVALTLQYADLNRPQTITAPTDVQPYSQFSAKLRTFIAGIESSVTSGGGLSGSSGG